MFFNTDVHITKQERGRGVRGGRRGAHERLIADGKRDVLICNLDKAESIVWPSIVNSCIFTWPYNFFICL